MAVSFLMVILDYCYVRAKLLFCCLEIRSDYYSGCYRQGTLRRRPTASCVPQSFSVAFVPNHCDNMCRVAQLGVASLQGLTVNLRIETTCRNYHY
jgi:hypothetical protein